MSVRNSAVLFYMSVANNDNTEMSEFEDVLDKALDHFYLVADTANLPVRYSLLR